MKLYFKPELEEQILGVYLSNPNLFYESKLQPNYFYKNRNRLLFEAMIKLRSEDIQINIVSVSTEVTKYKENKWLPSEVTGLLEHSMYRSAVETIERELINLYEKRNFTTLIQESLVKLQQEEDFNTLKNELIKGIENNIDSGIEIKTIKECVEKAIEVTEQAYQNGGKITGLQSGYKRLDAIINGFEKPSYIVVGARPGVGKTALSLELAKKLSKENEVLYFSLEMPFEQLGQRILASSSSIPLKSIKTGNIKGSTFNKLLETSSLLTNNKLRVIEKENLRIEELVNICTTQNRKIGLDVVIIDYFTLLKSYKNFRELRHLYNYISEEIRMLAKKLNISIILLAQCNRKADDKRELQLSDLKETANLEQDANIVMFLESKDDNEFKREGEVREDKLRLTIRKNRSGENNMEVLFKYYKSTQILEEERAARILMKND